MNQIAADTYLAAAVVVHEACVLIVRRSYRERFLPGAWGVPCGKLDRGESAESGALRELKEETGILGTIVAHTGSSSFLSDYRGRRVHNHQENFIVRPLTLDVVLPSPDQAHLWARPAELAEIGVDAYNLEVIRQALGGRLDAAGLRAMTARSRYPAPPVFSSPKTLPARRVRQDRRPAAAESWAADRPARRRRS
ncbi:NUDIX hydrolase [Streptomyces decoyicus]|uniref:NUDIX hydrolase n=1 Tax=Streptomyces decoyicus TaxID=249567 RepID=UPI0007C7721F|nr:NUDIX hydrolase [Streptomyces decoyicus]